MVNFISISRIIDIVPTPQKADQVIGVDLGRREIAVTSLAQSWSGENITKVRDRFSRVRASVQKKGTSMSKKAFETAIWKREAISNLG